jgi:hypothetical protein
MGFIVEDGYNGQTVTETFSCCHCNAIVVLTPGRAMCSRCFKPVCERCHAHGRCIPLEKKLERIERQVARARTRRSMGIE